MTPTFYYERAGTDYLVFTRLSPRGALITLGHVIRGRRSTDSKIAGTRLRRVGKGATEWAAEVPRDDWLQNAGDLLPRRQLQGCYDRTYRLEYRGETWDRREDAARALLAWHTQTRSALDASAK